MSNKLWRWVTQDVKEWRMKDEELAQSLGLNLQIQGFNAEKAFTSQHIRNCQILELEEKG